MMNYIVVTSLQSAFYLVLHLTWIAIHKVFSGNSGSIAEEDVKEYQE